jgi:ADP-ribosyl-[dinitrogen reductase] hydrolase
VACKNNKPVVLRTRATSVENPVDRLIQLIASFSGSVRSVDTQSADSSTQGRLIDDSRPKGRIGLADRLAGGVWGHLVGDALGVPYEFKPPSDIGDVVWGHTGTHHQPPGTWSDDGGLMLALLDSLLSVEFDTTDQGHRFLQWSHGKNYAPGPPFDIGATTSHALRRLDAGVRAEEAGGRSVDDNGNGSLMRILPIALRSPDAPAADLVTMAMRSSAVTHGHARAGVACAVYCLLARGLL